MKQVLNKMQGISDMAAILFAHGVQTVIVCPGSRNAPLIQSFVTFGKFNLIRLTDERSAAYFAMGVAQSNKIPVVVCGTSGTAAINFAPALAEAFYQKIPLIAITADRPEEWTDQGDGQTIRQHNLYHNFIKYQTTLPTETTTKEDLWLFRRKLSEGLIQGKNSESGPLHFNVPIREPLYELLPKFSDNLHVIRKHSSHPSENIDLKEFTKKWASYSKKMIIVGMMNKNDDLIKILNRIDHLNEAVIVAENISNVHGQNIITTPESLISSLSENDWDQYTPQLLISIGNHIVSKKMKIFLRKQRPVEHWQLSSSNSVTDTFQNLTEIIPMDPLIFLEKMIQSAKGSKKGYSKLFENQKQKLEEKQKLFFSEKIPFTDLLVVKDILEKIPGNWNIHLANSSPVRLSQLCSTRNDLFYYANRGTSGIDGCTSTASGSAYSSKRNTLLITGDLAFIYDSNGLWNHQLSHNLKIIVLNNGGGNIFKLISTGESYNEIHEFLETPHTVKISYIAKAFGIRHWQTDNFEGLHNILESFLSYKSSAILEVKTDMNKNMNTFKSYFKHISEVK